MVTLLFSRESQVSHVLQRDTLYQNQTVQIIDTVEQALDPVITCAAGDVSIRSAESD